MLKANLIELPELKRPKKTNQVDNLNYYKYHSLISHPLEKYFMLKYKIVSLNENVNIILNAKMIALNITTMVNLSFH